ncbi:MAG TPA: N-acyl homoserine lactonase family protein [Roseomonas sp.]|jgi:glyoxylase-like metal-dependent hydrolase (beta-lactamase superfamily II)
MQWEVLSLRYARHDKKKQESFMMPVDDPHSSLPLDYYVWLLRAPDGSEIVVDSGFDAATAAKRGRVLMRPVGECLKAAGTDPDTVKQVVITHLHYDHAGNLDLFPHAQFHLQEREMRFATGRNMCFHCLRHPFEVEDVVRMVRALYADRLTFHDGDAEIAPGVSVHHVGGHSDGLQMVRVQTARGPLVLAADASHFYLNMQRQNPFPIVYDVGAMAAGWKRALQLAGGDESLVIPGHDPIISERFPAVPGSGGEIVALHLPPVA